MTLQERDVAKHQLLHAIHAIMENQSETNEHEGLHLIVIDMYFIRDTILFYLSDNECDWFIESFLSEQDANILHLREVFPTITWKEIEESY